MKIREFSKSLEESFSTFFGSEVENKITFMGEGVFYIKGYLVPQEGWIETTQESLVLYQIRVEIPEETPVVKHISFPFTGEVSPDYIYYTLGEALVYIKENLATIKSKTIYENL